MLFSTYNWQFIRKWFTRCMSVFRLQKNERIIHHSLDESFIKKFSEVLIIGDVHGCFDELSELLDKINNNDSILKIFVGDLVNKGPKNSQVLTFLMKNKNNCLSVVGNHDAFTYECYRDEEKCDAVNMHWVKSLTEEQVLYLESLPFSISIPSLNCIIVHAGIKPGISLHEQNLEDLLYMRNLLPTSENGQWKATKSIIDGIPWATKWSGPQHIYFGHDAARELQIEANATGLDTGAVYGKCLTGIFISGIRNGQYCSVKSHKAYKPINNL